MVREGEREGGRREGGRDRGREGEGEREGGREGVHALWLEGERKGVKWLQLVRHQGRLGGADLALS